jgi:hypothetical protein
LQPKPGSWGPHHRCKIASILQHACCKLQVAKSLKGKLVAIKAHRGLPLLLPNCQRTIAHNVKYSRGGAQIRKEKCLWPRIFATHRKIVLADSEVTICDIHFPSPVQPGFAFSVRRSRRVTLNPPPRCRCAATFPEHPTHWAPLQTRASAYPKKRRDRRTSPCRGRNLYPPIGLLVYGRSGFTGESPLADTTGFAATRRAGARVAGTFAALRTLTGAAGGASS